MLFFIFQFCTSYRFNFRLIFFQGYADATISDDRFEALGFEPQPGALKYVIPTKPGPGPQVIELNKSLVEEYPCYKDVSE